MKATKYLSLAALALMGTLASCQSDDEASIARPDNAVGINVTVGSLQTTRSNPAATDDTQREFNLGDQISVSTDGQDPVLFQCTNADQQTWTEAVPGKFLLWKQNEMTFKAYYPATDGTSMTAFNLPADQSSEAKIALADYMTRQQTRNNESGTDIYLDLQRKMARVIVRISFADQYFDDQKTVSNVRIYSEASGIEDGNPTGSSAEIQPYAQGDGGQGSTYTALVVPGYGDSGARFIQLSDGEGSTLLVKGIPGLEAGNSYTFNLTVGKNRIEVASVTVQDWTTGETLAGGQATEASSVTEVTTFSELNTALSAGKNVKLMNDIDCTAGISITSNGALTIDGNGKKLSTTSAIRAFQVGSSATVAFKDLTLTGFVSGGGPAINNTGGTIVLDGCTISNCHVNNKDGGGAIENKSNGKLYAINTTFSGNYSGEIGGAINNYNSSLYMSGCTFTNNYTTKSDAYYGGAIGINGGSEVRLINCAFSGNKYGTNTGTSDIGVYNKPTNYTIAGCTGATIASGDGDITTIASGTATLDYSDLSNISFTYNVPPTYTLLSAATIDDIGKVVCAAGHLHDAKTAVPAGCTAVGILGMVADTGHGLILALKNATSQTWNTINGWASASYAGTTLKVLPDDAARGTNLTSYTTLGETAVSNWAVGQKSDYEAIFTKLGSTRNSGGMTYDNNVNAYITTGVGGTAMSGTYWSATQDDDYDAWYFLASYWDNDYKTYTYYVRPVLGF